MGGPRRKTRNSTVSYIYRLSDHALIVKAASAKVGARTQWGMTKMYIAALATGVLTAYLKRNTVEAETLPSLVEEVTSAFTKVTFQALKGRSPPANDNLSET